MREEARPSIQTHSLQCSNPERHSTLRYEWEIRRCLGRVGTAIASRKSSQKARNCQFSGMRNSINGCKKITWSSLRVVLFKVIYRGEYSKEKFYSFTWKKRTKLRSSLVVMCFKRKRLVPLYLLHLAINCYQSTY